MAENRTASIPAWRLDALRTELADLAYELERQRRPDAADVANLLAGRLAELAASPGDVPEPARDAPIFSS